MEDAMTRVFVLIILLAAPLTADPVAAAPVAPSAATEWSGQFCTREYRPVCARTRFRLRTFPNRCEARVAGARFVHPGRCRGRR
jgi:hypothetical protein